jgi:2'-5' RNA ligase
MSWRLFIAHPVPSVIRQQLRQQLAPYRLAYPDVRWTRPQSWHLTLVFLGSVDPTCVPELETLVDRVAGETTPYSITAETGGGRMRGGEGVAWLGLNTGAGRLLEVAQELFERCPPNITVGAPPKRTPSAHLTVARRADQTTIDALQAADSGQLGVGWPIDRIQLVRSHLRPHGAEYVTLYEATL